MYNVTRDDVLKPARLSSTSSRSPRVSPTSPCAASSPTLTLGPFTHHSSSVHTALARSIRPRRARSGTSMGSSPVPQAAQSVATTPDRSPASECRPGRHARTRARAQALPSLSPKRFIVSAKTFAWKDTIELLAKKRPELKERLPVITGTEPPVGPFATLDTRKTESVLGMKSYVECQDSFFGQRGRSAAHREGATASHVARPVRGGLRVREVYR